ncbi:MAG: SpoIIE family protein phosphatase [Candidatus Muirbacterium halophilum]|nr:SpoIIE family protein phosphatase [Candidatus Muirbacterium halophilum]MCK9476443.1 SpoIIE family protein phosphatase [Candidatus Muirbacterium halophilum]
MSKVFIDSEDFLLKDKISTLLLKEGFDICKKFDNNIDYYIVDFNSSKYLSLIPVERIMVIIADIEDKNKLSDYSSKLIFYKPLIEFEYSKIVDFITGFKTNKTDILSAVYITSKQLEKINNDFRERIDQLSENISNSYILDSQFFLDELIRIIIDYISDYVGAENVSVLFLDNRKKQDILYNIEIREEKFFKKTYLVERGNVTQSMIKLNESVLVDNILETKFNEFMNNLKIYNTKSFIAVPVKFKKNPVAIIYVTDKKKGNFSAKDLKSVETISKSLERFFNEKIHRFKELLNVGIKKEKSRLENSALVSDLTRTITLLKKTQEELKIKSNELNVLYNINSFVKNTIVIEELLKMIVDTIIYSMKVKRASVLLISNSTEDILVSGVIGKKGSRVENLKIENRGKVSSKIIEKGNSIIIAANQFNDDYKDNFCKNYETTSFVAVPVKIRNEVVAIINVTDRNDGNDFNDDDKKVLEILANQTAVTIDNFRLSSQLIEKEKITHELNIARDIQMKLIPTEKYQDKYIEVNFKCIPAKEVGGDYVDLIHIDENNKGIVIGDVSGKGVPAALLMVMLRTLLRSFAYRELSPAILMEKVNNLIIEDIDPKVFATLFYGIYDEKNKVLRFCNAGHNYPIIVRNGKIIKELATNDVVLGFFPNYQYHEDSIRVEKDDIIYLYTDGAIEAQNEHGKIFSTEQFYDIILNDKYSDKFEKVIETIREYSGKASFSDDLTLCSIRILK